MPTLVSSACVAFQLSFGLRDGFVGVNTVSYSAWVSFRDLCISHHRRIQQLFESVLPAQLEVIGGQFRLRGQAGILQVGGAGLSVRDAGANQVAHAAKQVGRPGSVNR